MTKALTKAAGSLSLYWLVTRQPPTMVAALLANVNWEVGAHTHTHTPVFHIENRSKGEEIVVWSSKGDA